MAIGYPGGFDTYIPTLELSGNLMVEFGRDLTKFPVNRYCRVTPVKQRRGAYLRFDPLSLVRLKNEPVKHRWALGTPRPVSSDETLGFLVQQYQTARENFNVLLDRTSVDVANWPIMKMHTEALAQRAMTHRAYRVANTIFTTSNYDATHVFTATTANGFGFTEAGSTGNPVIKRTLDYAARIIQQDTMGSVRWGSVSVLINHNTALRWSATREFREYLMQQPEAQKMITLGQDKNYNAAYGLPSTLYGFNLIVEDTFYNPYKQGNASETGTVVVPDNYAAVIVADGPQVVEDGGRSYNTAHLFEYEGFNAEVFDDPVNRIVSANVVDDFDVQIVAPVSGCVITNLFS